MEESVESPLPSAVVYGGATPTHVLFHLLGVHQGSQQVLSGDFLLIGTAPDTEIHFPTDGEPAVAACHATLTRDGATYLLRAEPGRYVEVNKKPVTSRTLVAGDTIRIGKGGPVLRYRYYEGAQKPYKSIPEAVKDCVDCARQGSSTRRGQVVLFLKSMPREFFTQISPWSRGVVLLLLFLLLTTTGVLLLRTSRLAAQLEQQAQEVHSISGLLEQTEENALSVEALRSVRAELESRLLVAEERVEALEARSGAGRRVVAEASNSVVFLQGSYGFVDASGRPLRMVLGLDGRPITDLQGNPRGSFSGAGPVLERLYTGTAFVVTEDGLLLTNKHLAVPWAFDASAQALVNRGLTPVMHRLIGYLPGEKEPFDVALVEASQTADVAVLRCGSVTGHVTPLPLSEAPAQPGEEVFVLGYPTGIRALLARTNQAFVDSLMRGGPPDFWTMARQLSEAGHIGPLATRGIVGQVTSAKVVYDAETTSGGSGGPVLGLDGTVKAVNAAILIDFDGSNLGVPAEEARRLLERATGKRTGGSTP